MQEGPHGAHRALQIADRLQRLGHAVVGVWSHRRDLERAVEESQGLRGPIHLDIGEPQIDLGLTLMRPNRDGFLEGPCRGMSVACLEVSQAGSEGSGEVTHSFW